MSLLACFAGHYGVVLDPHKADQNTEDYHYQNTNKETPAPQGSVRAPYNKALVNKWALSKPDLTWILGWDLRWFKSIFSDLQTISY